MIDQLQAQIKAVAQARATAKLAADAKTAARLLWESEHKDLIVNAEETDRFRQLAEDNLRLMTLQIYAETGEKKPCEGVAVRIVTELHYDAALALAYAKEHGVALKLDVASFDKMAKIPELRPGFVTVEEKPQATISTVLEIK